LRRNGRCIKKRLYRDLSVTDEDKNNAEKNENVSGKEIAKEGEKTIRAGSIIKMPKKTKFIIFIIMVLLMIMY